MKQHKKKTCCLAGSWCNPICATLLGSRSLSPLTRKTTAPWRAMAKFKEVSDSIDSHSFVEWLAPYFRAKVKWDELTCLTWSETSTKLKEIQNFRATYQYIPPLRKVSSWCRGRWPQAPFCGEVWRPLVPKENHKTTSSNRVLLSYLLHY